MPYIDDVMFWKIYKRDKVEQNSRTSSLRASRSTQQVRKIYTSRLHFAASETIFFTLLVSQRRKVLHNDLYQNMKICKAKCAYAFFIFLT